MATFLKQLGSVIAAILLALAVGGLGYTSYMWPRWKVTSSLENEGYTGISLSHAFWNRAPIQCGGEDVDIFTYTAILNNRSVQGFACYRGAIWGVAHWDN